MTERNRAWRRRKTRIVLSKVKATKDWILEQFSRADMKPNKELKHHRHGALTHVQDLRSHWTTEQELREAA